MIILDSNILKGISLRGPEAELLRAIRKSGVERVAAPWIVLEELAAQQAILYRTKYEAAMAAMEALRKATPWARVSPPAEEDPYFVRVHWRGQYSELAETIETSADAYKEALFREANLLPPCKAVNSGKHKTGARDAAIWLTAVEYAKEHPMETVYFVSNNTEDFGDGTSFKSLLAQDIEDLAGRLVLYTSLDDVLTRFARKVEADAEVVKHLLSSSDTMRRITGQARIASYYRPFQATVSVPGDAPINGLAYGFTRAPSAYLASVDGVRGYEINGHIWYAANTRWLLAGQVKRDRSSNGRQRQMQAVYCSWKTNILLNSETPEIGATILRKNDLEPIAPDDAPLVPKIPVDDLIADLIEKDLAELAAQEQHWDDIFDLRNAIIDPQPFHGDNEWPFPDLD